MKNIILLILLLGLSFQSYALSNDNFPMKKFQILRIKQIIRRLNPKVTSHLLDTISYGVWASSKIFKIDARLMLTIIDIESEFNQESVSESGDYSIAQIYYEYWNKPKRKSKLIKTGHLLPTIKSNMTHALLVMGEILYLEKKSNDNYWFANYHSRTPEFRKIWIDKLKKSFYKIKDLPL